MTPIEFVQYLQGIETPNNNSFNFYRQSYRASDDELLVSNNLERYLAKMQKLNPTVLLVGEAPGYKGCKLTGIPFTSEYQVVHDEFFADGFEVLNDKAVDKEISATVIWSVLSQVKNKPLMWNIYPFHPVDIDGRNGKPRRCDIKVGLYILELLLQMFNIQEIYCLGRTASDALCYHPLFRGYIRHPSHGGQTECRVRLCEILK